MSLALSGGLLLLAAYFLLSAAVRRKPYFLCLVFCCVLTALRDQNFFVVHLLAPDASWYLAYRALILIVMLMPVSILLMLKCQYWKASAQGPLWAYLGMAAAAGVLICLLPVSYTHLDVYKRQSSHRLSASSLPMDSVSPLYSTGWSSFTTATGRRSTLP